MISIRRLPLIALVLWVMAGLAGAQDPIAPRLKVAQEPKPIVLTISPRKVDPAAFRHRLFPLESERVAGDAAPIYLRLHGEFTDGMRQLSNGKAREWLGLPLDRLPVAEARAFADRFRGKVDQIRFGTRRRSCDWNYTLPEERDHAYSILLPDAQEMRQWGRMLALKARVEVAEGRTDEAIRTIEVGLGFARHVGEGPFLVNGLIGVSLASEMLQQADELIARPDAPNLYWPLTALPRPFIDFRAAFENELSLTGWIFPELGEVDRPATPAGWSSLLAGFHARLARFLEESGLIDAELRKTIRFEVDLGRFRASTLPEARDYLRDRAIPTGEKSEDQVLMVFFAGIERELRDDFARPFHLEYADAGPIRAEVDRLRERSKAAPLAFFVALLPFGEQGIDAGARLDRKVAALRAIEAIRMQAAADGGKFPEKLGAVTVVPVPDDPMTGRPFGFRRDGDVLVLESALPGDDRLAYRLTPRK